MLVLGIEKKYFHCAKHIAPRSTRNTLNMSGCGAGIWTTQLLEHRNKESKHVCSHKTKGKGSCLKQILKAMCHAFLNS